MFQKSKPDKLPKHDWKTVQLIFEDDVVWTGDDFDFEVRPSAALTKIEHWFDLADRIYGHLMGFNRDAETNIELLRFEMKRILRVSPELRGLPYETERYIARDVARTFYKYKNGGRCDDEMLERGLRFLYFAGSEVTFVTRLERYWLSLPKIGHIEIEGAEKLLYDLDNGAMRIKSVMVRRNAEGEYLAAVSFERLSHEEQGASITTRRCETQEFVRQVLTAAHDRFQFIGADKLSSTDILELLAEIDMKMHAREFAKAMDYAGAGKPKQINLGDGKRPNGYLAEDVYRAFDKLQERIRDEAGVAECKRKNDEAKAKIKEKGKMEAFADAQKFKTTKAKTPEYDPDNPDEWLYRNAGKSHSFV